RLLHDDRGPGTWSASRISDDSHGVKLHANGTVSATADLREFVISPGATLEVTLREPGIVRQLTMRADAQGRIDQSWVVNGREQPWDASAAAWLASFIEDLDRHTAFAARSRVPQLLQAGGVDRVVSEVERIDSSYAKSVYLGLLIESVRFEPNQLVRVLRALRSLQSDYERAN